MSTFRALIDAYGLPAFSRAIGVPMNTAKQMRKRSSVAAEHWRSWVTDAERLGKDQITYAALAEAAAERASANDQRNVA